MVIYSWSVNISYPFRNISRHIMQTKCIWWIRFNFISNGRTVRTPSRNTTIVSYTLSKVCQLISFKSFRSFSGVFTIPSIFFSASYDVIFSVFNICFGSVFPFCLSWQPKFLLKHSVRFCNFSSLKRALRVSCRTSGSNSSFINS